MFRGNTARFAAKHRHARTLYGYSKPRTFNLPDFTPEQLSLRAQQAGLVRLVDSYRRHGHRAARLDPLDLLHRPPVAALDPRRYGFPYEHPLEEEYKSKTLPEASAPAGQSFNVDGILYHARGQETMQLEEIVNLLQQTYCQNIGFEFMHLSDKSEREWIARALETAHAAPVSDETKRRHWRLLHDSEIFDHFLDKRFPSVKRYGLEGAESMLLAVDRLMKDSAESGIEDVVISMMHRGRLNLLTQLLNFDHRVLFRKMKGLSELPHELLEKGFGGDVISHLFLWNQPINTYGQKTLRTYLLPNPSFLQAIAPVGQGVTRALQMQSREGPEVKQLGDTAINIQLHGDAAFVGQGIMQESLNLSQLPYFNNGGSIHLVVNNQLGYTTQSAHGRSSFYATDLAKAIAAPVLHVNSDYPDSVAAAASIAFQYRAFFRKDVIIDLVSYRRMGHNELDDPSYTNPGIYVKVKSLKSVPKKYEAQLLEEGVITAKDVASHRQATTQALESKLEQAETFEPEFPPMAYPWSEMTWTPESSSALQTGANTEALQEAGKASVTVPEGFSVHPRLTKLHIAKRLEAMKSGEGIDWSTAEALAFGTLMQDGYHVRICGQDSGRGTFSQRHAVLTDQQNESACIPLNSLASVGRLDVAASPLSEFAVMGFEQGMSWTNPRLLNLWEAQFGDFFTGAQIMIDNFLTSGESKWAFQSALTLLLPHGYDGAGPEHSSARIERFLQLSAGSLNQPNRNPNIHIAQPTTASQYFHVLRRQMLRSYRKPLVLFTPKSTLRLPPTASSLVELTQGSFTPVLTEGNLQGKAVKRVVFLSGQLYYKLVAEREKRGLQEQLSFVRLEEFAPFPWAEVKECLSGISSQAELVWAQEEPENAGAYLFVLPRLVQCSGKPVQYIGRKAIASPSTGIPSVFKAEQASLVEEVFKL